MKRLSSSAQRPLAVALATVAVVLSVAALIAVTGCQNRAGTSEQATANEDLMRPPYAPKEGQGLDRDIARQSRNLAGQKARGGAVTPESGESAAAESASEPASSPSTWGFRDPADLDQEPLDPGHPGVVITLKGGREIVVELFPDKAPETVTSFIKQVEEGYHDGTFFHRSDDMCIQGGDGSLVGKQPWPNVKRELTGLPFEAGSLGLARTEDPDSGNSQYFICKRRSEHLDAQYCNFGRTLQGMDVVLEMPARALGARGTPEDESAAIETIRMVRFQEEE